MFRTISVSAIAAFLLLGLHISAIPVFAQKADRKPVSKPREIPNKTPLKKKGSTPAGATATTEPAGQGIRITVRLEDKTHSPIGGSAQFGIVHGATICVDAQLGESYLPPNPPAGLPDLRFVNPRGKNDDCFDLGINNDFRPYRNADQSDTFKVSFQAPQEGYPIIVKWDSLAKQFNGEVEFRVPLNGKGITVDMKKQTWAAIQEEVPAFYIVASKPVMEKPKGKK